MTTYDTASSTSTNGVSWLDTLGGLAKTGADVYTSVSNAKTNATTAKTVAPAQAASTANTAKIVTWAVIGLVVVILGFVGFAFLRPGKGK